MMPGEIRHAPAVQFFVTQKLVLKEKSGANIYHFVFSPGSIESLAWHLKRGWTVKYRWDESERAAFLLERTQAAVQTDGEEVVKR